MMIGIAETVTGKGEWSRLQPGPYITELGQCPQPPSTIEKTPLLEMMTLRLEPKAMDEIRCCDDKMQTKRHAK